jgi:hypothetical protein
MDELFDDLGPRPSFDPRARPKFESQGAQAAPRIPGPCVPWLGRTYAEIQDTQLMDRLHAHMQALKPEKRLDYALYLVNHCGFPKSFSDAYRRADA